MSKLGLLMVLLAGCGVERTEMLVRVFNDGLVVPTDVDSVRFRVTDRDGGVRREQTLQLCRPGGSGQGCFSFPITALLIPGDSAPDSDVAVEVDAVSKVGATVIANAAKFRFSRATTQHIDFVFYPDCLNQLTCAATYQVCLKNGMCGNPVVGTLDTDMDPKSQADLTSSSLDMSANPSTDQSVPFDFSLPDFSIQSPDLRFPGFDFSSPDMFTPPQDFSQAGQDLKDMFCAPVCSGSNCNFSCGMRCTCTFGTCDTGTGNCVASSNDSFQMVGLDLP